MNESQISRALIVHGSYGSPDGNWFPWLEKKLEGIGILALTPRFPTPEGQNLENWREVLAHDIGTIGPGWLLFGHSLGVAFLLDTLEHCDAPVEAFFAVSGFTGLLDLEEFDSVNATFVEREFDWPTIVRATRRSFVYQGDDDPYVPQKWGECLSTRLHAERRVIPRGGHLNAEADYRRFDELWEDVEAVVAECTSAPR